MHQTHKTKIMKKVTLNDQSYLVDEQLADYTIYQKPSSNIDFFGVDETNKKLFVQFKGGSGCYLYSQVPDQLLKDIPFAESIGRLVSGVIVNKFPSEKISIRLVVPAIAAKTEPTF
jgi:hypothetical protein